MSVLEAVKRANATKRPETSVALRVAVLASVLVAVLAAWVGGAASGGDAVAALALLPVGAWVSHRRRERDNSVIKLLLTAGAIAVLWRFLGQVQGSVTIDDTRAPLASLFLWVQVLHGFDLPQRRDVGFTLASSLALIALAGVSAHAGAFAVLLAVYAVLAGASLVGLQRSAARELADTRRDAGGLTSLDGGDPSATLPLPDVRRMVRSLAGLGTSLLRGFVPVLLVGALVFLVLPRGRTAAIGTLPFSGFPSFSLGSSRVANPGLDGNGSQRPEERAGMPGAFNPTAYFGFAEYVDLRTVGKLSDDPVMRVRADRPRLWRGMVFDTYDGRGWSRSAQEEPTPTYGVPVRFGPAQTAATLGRSPLLVPTSRLVQTFELLADTPNLVFAAADPREVYLSAGAATRWDDGTVTTSGVQEAGIVYSVVSEVAAATAPVLRTADGPVPDEVIRQYTQLPDDVPGRVHELAATLTADTTTSFGAAEAVQTWLGEHTRYTLEAGAPPAGADTVDHFLFVSRAGWCEPIASSMVVLLRSAGVPARFATGFQPGRRNPITGVWDVAMSDAHAWVEVWVPAHGWIAFDPTGAVPEAVRAGPGGGARLPLLELMAWIGDRSGVLVPASVRAAVRRVAGVVVSPVGLLALAGAGASLLLAGRRRRPAGARSAAPPGSPFGRLVALMAARGVVREPWQTPREFVARVRLRRPAVPSDALDVLLADEEARRYGGRASTSASLTQDALARVAQALTGDDPDARATPPPVAAGPARPRS